MTKPVIVAVFIDRGEAIRAARNTWDWQNTELDLESLDPGLREVLSRCPEKDGTLQITHSASRPGAEQEWWLRAKDLCDSFELEREGMPFLVEATPSTALQMLEHLASLPIRIRTKGAALLSSAQVQATTRGAQAMDQVEAYVTELDRWLSAAPNQLITEHEEPGFHQRRFHCKEAPNPPILATIQDSQIVYDLEEAHRLLDGELPRVSSARPGDCLDTFNFSTSLGIHTTFEHLAAAENILAEDIRTRADAVTRQRRAIAAAVQECFQAWQDAQQKQVQEERRIAAIKTLQALEARKHAGNNQAIREWATTYGKSEILALLNNDAPAEQITDTLRSTLFEPLAGFAVFRKIRKKDLLIANPNLDDSGLDAVFDDTEDGFTDPSHQAAFQAVAHASVEAEIPAQFAPRLHRGRLTRRGETIGTHLEARSLLLTAHFGDLKISRAFAIGTLAPTKC
jgi:hypothetical protein